MIPLNQQQIKQSDFSYLETHENNLQFHKQIAQSNYRTLPRDVIKWMQGLDLSYSVKDYRKDMSNGFLIGEIISRYQPGKIPMHAFENSNNLNRRENNWNQLELFFKKHTLRTIQISHQDYSKIKSNNDPKSDHLFNFICHLYSICTKRTIPENTPVLDLPPTQNPNLTTSYLLKDEGLQKLQNNSGLQSNPSQLQNSAFSDKNPDRIPTRKIASNIEAGDLVDATGVGIKVQGRKVTSKKKTWNFDQQKEASVQDQENAEPDRLIFDYLHSIMEECLPTQDPTIRELLFPDEARFSATETLLRNVHSVDQEYLMSFLTQVNLNVEEMCTIILREINETWKFFTYFFKMFKPLAENWEAFMLACDVISTYARHCHSKEPKRLSKVFYDGLLTTLINEVKLTNNLRKKYRIMDLVYDFSGRELEEKKNVLSRLKDEINSSNVLYIQWLSVLVKEQAQKEKDGKLLDDFIYYAQQYLSSSSSVSRTSALKILSEISKSHCSLVEKFFLSKTSVFRNSKDDPEQVYLLIDIYFNIMEEVVQSQQYQQLVKGVGSNNLVKAYNPDNQKNAEDLKNKVNIISEAIKQLCELSANPSIREICSKKSILFIQESKHMMQVFLDYIYASSPKSAFFNSAVTEHEFKSMTVEAPGVGVAAIKEYCNEIFMQIISLKTTRGYSIEQFIQLINVCMENLNVKKINMQFWQDVSLHIVKAYTRLMIDLQYSKLAVEGLIKVFNIYFNFDMKIRQLSQWIAEAINHYQESWGEISSEYENKDQAKSYIEERINELNEWLNGEYQKSRNDMVSFIVNQISENLSSSKQHKLIYLKP